MLFTKFANVLVCDVVENEFEGKIYYSAVIYTNRSLIRVALPSEYKKAFDDYIGCYVTFEADLRTFDGKSKYKYNGTEIELKD